MLTIEKPARISDSSEECSFQTMHDAEIRRQIRLMEAMKSQYGEDQQAKFLDLQAEADSLLQQLRALKEQRDSDITPMLSASSV
jgi:hypothetical protein